MESLIRFPLLPLVQKLFYCFSISKLSNLKIDVTDGRRNFLSEFMFKRVRHFSLNVDFVTSISGHSTNKYKGRDGVFVCPNYVYYNINSNSRSCLTFIPKVQKVQICNDRRPTCKLQWIELGVVR